MKGSGAKSVQIITDTDPDPDYTENPRKSSLKLFYIFTNKTFCELHYKHQRIKVLRFVVRDESGGIFFKLFN
jgi:hypothetical protein